MASQLQLKERKASLLAAVRKINAIYSTEEGKAAVSMIRTTKECDKRVVARYARGVKDPEPLATTMLLMAKKTPFLAREDMLEAFTPEERRECLTGNKDARVRGKVYCSKRAFDIWLSKEQEIDDQTASIIALLYKQSDEMVSQFYSFNWHEAKLQVGYLPKARRMMPTRIPLVDVPPSLRQVVIAELIQPGASVYTKEVTDNYMESVKEVLKGHIVTGMPFVDQARILLSLMDPKYKWVPTIQLTDDVQTVHSHAIFGHNWKVVNLKSSTPAAPSHLSCVRPDTSLLLRAAKACGSPHDASEALKTVTFNQEPLDRFLERQKDTTAIQFLKALLGVPTSNQSEYMGYTIIVKNPCENTIRRSSASGVSWNEYIGEEIVAFQREYVTGFFKHRGPIVSEITCTYVDSKDLSEVITMIGCYCKWEWHSSRKATIGAIHKECKLRLMKNPRELLRINSSNWLKFKRHLEKLDLANPDLPVTSVGDQSLGGGMITIVTDTATPEPKRLTFEVTEEWELTCSHPRARISYSEVKLPCPSRFLNEAWDSDSVALIPYLHPCKSFKKTLDYHVARPDLVSDILRGRYQHMNEHVVEWLPQQHREPMSTQAKEMLGTKREVIESTPRVYLSFLYMFAGASKRSSYKIWTSVIAGQTVSLLANCGMFRWQPEEDGGHWLYLDTLYLCPEDRRPMIPSTLALSGLEGYRFDNPKKRKPDCALDMGIKRLAREGDLASLTVRVEGDLVELIRDRTSQFRAGYSLKRALDKITEDRAQDLEERALQAKKRARTERGED